MLKVEKERTRFSPVKHLELFDDQMHAGSKAAQIGEGRAPGESVRTGDEEGISKSGGITISHASHALVAQFIIEEIFDGSNVEVETLARKDIGHLDHCLLF